MADRSKEAFLSGLTLLSKEFGICISGCGCCDSPYLVDQFDDWEKFDPDDGGRYVLSASGQLEWRKSNDE